MKWSNGTFLEFGMILQYNKRYMFFSEPSFTNGYRLWFFKHHKNGPLELVLFSYIDTEYIYPGGLAVE